MIVAVPRLHILRIIAREFLSKNRFVQRLTDELEDVADPKLNAIKKKKTNDTEITIDFLKKQDEQNRIWFEKIKTFIKQKTDVEKNMRVMQALENSTKRIKTN